MVDEAIRRQLDVDWQCKFLISYSSSRQEQECLDFDEVYNITENGTIQFNSKGIIKLHYRAFEGVDVRHLRILSLYGNLLRELPDAVFSELYELEVLDLGGNALKKLSSDTFANQKKLTRLQLQSNQLETLSTMIFSDMQYLQFLDLSGNLFMMVESSTFFGLDQITVLNLTQPSCDIDPVDCDGRNSTATLLKTCKCCNEFSYNFCR